MTEAIEDILGHRFTRSALLREAMTHRSAAGQQHGQRTHSNERMEFVGDRVLGLLIAEWLAERYPKEPEGHLGRRLAQLVSQPILSEVAQRLGLHNTLLVAPGEAKAGVRQRATVLADALEAALGALYLDGGLEPARRFVRSAWAEMVDAQAQPPKDFKSALQEWLEGRGQGLPAYKVIARRGPPHAPCFTVAARGGGREGTGEGSTKREAEQRAAEALMKQLAA